MNIIGYSGLNNSLSFRRQHFKNFTDQEYRMCQGLNSSACIVIDGLVVAAAEEERFNGEKFTCDFPKQAIDFCLQQAGLKIVQIDFICHGFDYSSYEKMYSLDYGTFSFNG